jgi:hypothetical protein
MIDRELLPNNSVRKLQDPHLKKNFFSQLPTKYSTLNLNATN